MGFQPCENTSCSIALKVTLGYGSSYQNGRINLDKYKGKCVRKDLDGNECVFSRVEFIIVVFSLIQIQESGLL